MALPPLEKLFFTFSCPCARYRFGVRFDFAQTAILPASPNWVYISCSRYLLPTGSLESLIEDVYVAALRPERWPATLRGIASATGSRDCVFQTLRISPSGAKVGPRWGGEISAQ